MLWISHHYETFTECRNEDSVAEIDTNSILMIYGLDPLLALYSSVSQQIDIFEDLQEISKNYTFMIQKYDIRQGWLKGKDPTSGPQVT